MSRRTEEYYEELRAKTDKILQVQPNIPATKLAIVLSVDYRVALRTLGQCKRARIEKIKNANIEDDLAVIVSLIEHANPEIAEIIFTKKGGEYKYSAGERATAYRALVEGNKKLIDMKMDAGIFSRNLGKLEIEGILNEEEKETLERALNYATKRIAKNAGQQDADEQPEVEEGTSA